MIILTAPQGSIEWITARLWRLTASNLKANITSKGALSKSAAATKAVDKLIAGIELADEMNSRKKEISEMDDWELKKFMSHYNGDSFSGSLHTERGHECEADAIAALSEKAGSQITDVGMCVMGNDINGVISCSPDGMDYAGGILKAGGEVKAPCLFNYYQHVADKKLPDEYALQVHSSMAMCEVDEWHFGSYFKGKPLFYHRVKRDNFTDTIATSLEKFKEFYQERYATVMEGMKALSASGADGIF